MSVTRWLEATVPEDWLDMNGHMNEARYLECFSKASDVWFTAIGVDQPYIDAGRSFFTVETHIRHLGEARLGEAVHVEARLLSRDGKKMRAFHWLRRSADNALLATGEHLYVHVDLTSRRACPPDPAVAAKIDAMIAADDGAWPHAAGRGVAAPRD